MRCDCNVSVRKTGEKKLGTRTEIKNVNSFRFVEKAVEYEIERQIDLLERGEAVVQETRLWDPDKSKTFTMRTKEDAQDYRYFPDPDLLPVLVTDAMIARFRSELPELPAARVKRFVEAHGLPELDARVLTSEREIADFYEKTTKVCNNHKASSNWIMTDLLRELNLAQKGIESSPITPEMLGTMIGHIDSGKISGKMAKAVFQEMWDTGKDPEAIIAEKGLVQVTDAGAIEKMVDAVLAANPAQVAEYKGGRTKVFGFFVGAVMKASKGQANPDIVNKILQDKLK